MAKLIFSQQELDNYLKEDKESLHPYYECNVKAAKRVSVHADGTFPDELIKERRPHEPQQVLEYREKIFVAITKPVFSKVWMSLKKIRRSQDWAIKYPKEPFTKINEKETLEQYCEKNYPDFTSVTNWAFDMFLRKYLIDSGAVGMIYPMDNFGIDVEENGFVKPVVELFCSEDVLDFQPGDYAVLRIPCGCKYYIKKEQKTEPGRSYYIVTTKEILRYDQIDAKENFKQVLRYEHGLDELPVRQMPGIILEHTEGRYKKETPIAAMLPELDEAVREYSDLQAAKVLHIYPERWEYTQNECSHCKGTGRRVNPAWTEDCNCESTISCTTCGGSGYIVAGPYSKIMVRPVNVMEGGAQIPNPPAGFIDKDTKIVELQEVGVKNHKYYALAAINFEFLADTPLSESGVAKEVDRDELNNTVHGIAEDIVSYIDWVYGVTAKYRYKALYNFDQILTMLPAIGVPEVYDLISSTHLQKELIEAKNGKLNPIIQSALENDYTAKRFNTEPEVRNRLQLIFKLDPLPNVSEEDKMVMLSNGGIDKISYIISSNINEFIQRALDEDPKFADKKLQEQKEKMNQYAAEIIPAEPIDIDGIMKDGDTDIVEEPDILGKVPLAIQQLSLAATRAEEAGNINLKNQILKKVDTLLATI